MSKLNSRRTDRTSCQLEQRACAGQELCSGPVAPLDDNKEQKCCELAETGNCHQASAGVRSTNKVRDISFMMGSQQEAPRLFTTSGRTVNAKPS